MSLNAKVCETSPEVVEAARDAGWEFMAHCYVQMSIHKVQDQAAMIGQSLDTLETFLGYRPRGWLGPGRTQKLDTLEHVADAGCDGFGAWGSEARRVGKEGVGECKFRWWPYH